MTTVNHECYVSLEVAKILKKAGFDWECRCYYETSGKLRGKNSGSFSNHNSPLIWQNNGNTDTQLYSAPTLAVAQRWLREVKHYVVEVNLSSCYDHFFCDLYYYKPPVDGRWVKCMQEEYDTYEEALEKGIQKCLTILLEEKQ